MPISIENGEAIIVPFASSFVGRFLGSTSEEGVFPPEGLQYSQFTFAPTVGSEGILVFGDYSNVNHFRFYAFYWKDGKLKVNDHVADSRLRMFASGVGEGNFGLMVRTDKHTYVTNIPKDSDATYLLVDPVVLMKYVDSKITIDQLHRNARTVKDRAKRAEGLKTALREIETLQSKLSLSESMRDTQNRRLQKKIQLYENLLKDLIRKLKESLVFSLFFPEELGVRISKLEIAES
jgi:hypothetical protein